MLAEFTLFVCDMVSADTTIEVHELFDGNCQETRPERKAETETANELKNEKEDVENRHIKLRGVVKI